MITAALLVYLYQVAENGVQFSTSDLLGPWGLTVGALIAIGFLTRWLLKYLSDYIASLQKTISDKQAIIDKKDEQIAAALKGWAEQTASNQTLANAQESRNRDDEMRHRLQDAAKAGGDR